MPSEEAFNHGEPTLNLIFRSTLQSGSETKDGPRELASEKETTNLSPPPTNNGETTSKPAVENSDTSPSTCGECLIDFDEEDTPFDEPPSPPCAEESPMVCADVVGSHAATPSSGHGQHLSAHSVSTSHSFCTNAGPSSIERQLTLVRKLFESKIAQIEAIPDSRALDSTIEAYSALKCSWIGANEDCTHDIRLDCRLQIH